MPLHCAEMLSQTLLDRTQLQVSSVQVTKHITISQKFAANIDVVRVRTPHKLVALHVSATMHDKRLPPHPPRRPSIGRFGTDYLPCLPLVTTRCGQRRAIGSGGRRGMLIHQPPVFNFDTISRAFLIATETGWVGSGPGHEAMQTNDVHLATRTTVQLQNAVRRPLMPINLSCVHCGTCMHQGSNLDRRHRLPLHQRIRNLIHRVEAESTSRDLDQPSKYALLAQASERSRIPSGLFLDRSRR